MRVVLLLLFGLMALACGAAPVAAPSAPSASASVSASPEWIPGMVVNIDAVKAGPGASTVTITASVAAGAPTCGRNPRIADQTESSSAIQAQVLADSVNPATCDKTSTVTLRLTAAAPIGNRPIVLNSKDYELRAGAYRWCPENLGCDPPANPCDGVWINYAVRGMDVSRHATGTRETCDGTWATITVPDDPAACGAEPRPGCTVATPIHRHFMKFKPGAGWQDVVVTTDPGCPASLPPDFPHATCAVLPAPGLYVTSGPPTQAPSTRPSN